MANANLTLLTLANTFEDQMVQVNNLANAINQLRNGLFYADNGNITLANGVLIIQDSTGTVVSVSGNATFSQQITSGSIQNQGSLTSQGNTALFTSNTVLVQVANTLIAKNLISNTVVTFQNVNVAGYLAFTGNNLNSVLAPLITVYNELATLNINSAFMVSNTGNVVIAKGLTVEGTANIATLNAANLIVTTLNAYDLILDPTATYSAVNGNVVINNLTVKGNQTILGPTVLSTDAFQLRSNAAADGDGYFQVYRGTTLNVNAEIFFNNTANVWQVSANDAQTGVTLLTTQNLVDNFTSTSNTNAATANAVNAAYAAAISNATTIVSNNSVFVAQRKGLNLIQGSGVSLNVAANTSNSNLVDITLSSSAVTAGANQQVQFNNNGSLGATSEFTFNEATANLFVGGGFTLGESFVMGPQVLSGPSSNQPIFQIWGQFSNTNLCWGAFSCTGTNFQLTSNANFQIDTDIEVITGGYLEFLDTSNINSAAFQMVGNTFQFSGGGINTWSFSTISISDVGNIQSVGQSFANNHLDKFSNTGTISANVVLNCQSGSLFDITLANNSNITFQNCAASGNVQTVHVVLRQTANGSNTVGWSNTIRWSDNAVPVLSTTANTGDMFQFSSWDGGTIWWGAQVYANVPLANTY